MLIHLGMTGVLSLAKRSHEVQTHDHVIFELNKGRKLFNDCAVLARLMPLFRRASKASAPRTPWTEPRRNIQWDYLYESSRGMKVVSRTLLWTLAELWVGNIYAAEALFQAGIHLKHLPDVSGRV